MSKEKPNESFTWKSKLEGLDSLPGEELIEKDSAWEKLQDRLLEKSASKKNIWYWTAAALLIAFLLPWMFISKKENVVVHFSIPGKQPKIKSLQTLQPDPDVPVAANAIIVDNQRQIEKNKKQILKTTVSANKAIKTKEPVLGMNELPAETEPSEAFTSVVLPDTAVVIITSVPEKKKMRVVHINELDAFSIQLASSPHHDQKAFSIQFGNNNSTTKNSAPQPGYTGIFKINLSSKN